MPSPRTLLPPAATLGLVLINGAALAEPAAAAAAVPDSPAAVTELVGRIDGLHRLPLSGVQSVRVGDRLLFVADNGRYVFAGPAFDLWHGARLETFDQTVALADPLCPHCRSLLSALPPLADRYRFRLVPLPVLGKGSQDAVLRLDCLAERDPAAARAAAARRAEGKGTPPIVIFGGSDFEAENRRRALGLGALGFTSEWPVLMGLIERTLGQSPEPH